MASIAGIASGAVLAIVFLVVFIVVTVIVVVKVAARKRADREISLKYFQRTERYFKGETASMIGNAAYNGTVIHNTAIAENVRDTVIYDYPHQGTQYMKTIQDAKKTKVEKKSSINQETRPTTLYVMNLPSHRNEAYGIPHSESLEESYVRYY